MWPHVHIIKGSCDFKVKSLSRLVGAERSFANGDNVFNLSCDLTRPSCDFMGGKSKCYITILTGLVAIDIVMVEI